MSSAGETSTVVHKPASWPKPKFTPRPVNSPPIAQPRPVHLPPKAGAQ